MMKEGKKVHLCKRGFHAFLVETLLLFLSFSADQTLRLSEHCVCFACVRLHMEREKESGASELRFFSIFIFLLTEPPVEVKEVERKVTRSRRWRVRERAGRERAGARRGKMCDIFFGEQSRAEIEYH
jgi:hypothetical protein